MTRNTPRIAPTVALAAVWLAVYLLWVAVRPVPSVTHQNRPTPSVTTGLRPIRIP